jgi:alpha-ketoglutarate-dependent 2,4-dichlorophenoxyacetate dioxygenase
LQFEPKEETTMKIEPIKANFGATISGVDLSQPLDAATIKEIGDAFAKYGVVVFRDQKLDNDTQARFGEYFGELEMSPKHYRSDNKHRIESKSIVDVSNLDENNKPRDKEDRRRLEALGNRLWHSDASFRPITGALSMLFAHAVPPKDGETEFADTRTGYDTLTDEMKEMIKDLKVVHLYGTSRAKLGFPSESEEERKNLPPVEHPLVRYHEQSGRNALYLGSHTTHIVHMLVPEGRVLLMDLLEHTTEKELVYRHAWKVGDLVVWDNRVTLHRGRLFDEKYPRDLRRVTTKDAPMNGARHVAAE